MWQETPSLDQACVGSLWRDSDSWGLSRTSARVVGDGTTRLVTRMVSEVERSIGAVFSRWRADGIFPGENPCERPSVWE